MKLIGFKKFSSKNGNACCYLFIEDDFRSDEVSRFGAVGTKCDQIGIYDKQVIDTILPSFIGKKINISYQVSNNRPYVSSVTVIQ